MDKVGHVTTMVVTGDKLCMRFSKQSDMYQLKLCVIRRPTVIHFGL